jgi:hypothetical protein
MEFYLAIKKNEIMFFAGKLIELHVKQSKVQKDKVCIFSLICGS